MNENFFDYNGHVKNLLDLMRFYEDMDIKALNDKITRSDKLCSQQKRLNPVKKGSSKRI